VGLIGGMGAGKSLVAAAFARRGARVISGDQLGHESLRQPPIKAALVQRWGPVILDEHGEVNRRRVGAIVFADADERRALESLVFPWIVRRFREEQQAAQTDPNVTLVVLDAAILLEAGWNTWCDWLVYVHAPREVRLQRLAEGRGWSAKEVVVRERAQMALTDKVSRADYALDNSGPPEETARQVDRLLGQWGILPE
jgi:dephospho-CoA kinase